MMYPFTTLSFSIQDVYYNKCFFTKNKLKKGLYWSQKKGSYLSKDTSWGGFQAVLTVFAFSIWLNSRGVKKILWSELQTWKNGSAGLQEGRCSRQGRRARRSLVQGTTCSTCSCTCWLYNLFRIHPWQACQHRDGAGQGSGTGALQKPSQLASGFRVNKRAHFGCRVRSVNSPKWAETYRRLL